MQGRAADTAACTEHASAVFKVFVCGQDSSITRETGQIGSFRGTLQQLLGNKHMAIWITAVIFSAIHMQFYGFIPRMLMGAMFGYVFVWTGCLWIPVVMHFTNNGLAVLAYYIFGTENSYADTIGAGATWWLGVISLMITSLGLLIFYRRTRKQ